MQLLRTGKGQVQRLLVSRRAGEAGRRRGKEEVNNVVIFTGRLHAHNKGV
jgi:hypothetical protein